MNINRPFTLAIMVSLALHAAVFAFGLPAGAPRPAGAGSFSVTFRGRPAGATTARPAARPAPAQAVTALRASVPAAATGINQTVAAIQQEPGSTAGDSADTTGGQDSAAAGPADAYLAALRARVEREKEYPAFARQLGLTGTTVVALSVASDGSLAGVSLAATSGHATLDKAALAAVRRAAPFGPTGGERLKVEIPITFRSR